MLVLLLAVSVFAVLSVLGDVRNLGHSLARFEGSALGVALALVLCNYALRFVRWQYYLRVLGVRVDAGVSGLVFLSGFLMSVTPGKMGEVFKSFLLQEFRGVAIARTVSAVIAERLLDLVALVVLVSIGGYGFPDGLWVAGAGAAIVSAIVLFTLFKPLGHFALDSLERFRVAKPVVPKLKSAYDALRTLTMPGPFVIGLLLSVVGWSFECAATWQLVRGFGEPAMSLFGAGYAYAAGTLAGALAMLPGGLGVAELGMAGLFHVVDPTLPLATAAAATILVRLCTLWFGVALGGVALLLLRTLGNRA